MINPDQIPPEVVEAAARASCREVERLHGSLETWRYFGFDGVDAFIDAAWPNYADQSRVAIAAAINAWPEVFQNPHGDYFITHRDAIILPLPTENPDAEA